VITAEKLSLTKRELQAIIALPSKLATRLGIMLTSKDDHFFSFFVITK